MSRIIRNIERGVITKRGWRSGSDLEDKAACVLSSVFTPHEVVQQHRVGQYRVDFAWPDIMLVLEVDSWHHRSPEGAAHDAQRDAWLRSEGWLVVRVDDRSGLDSMEVQLVRFCRLVHALRNFGEAETVRWWRKGPRTGPLFGAGR